MKVLKLDGGSYRIFKDDLTVMDRLEPKTYQIQFDKFVGFYLEERTPLTVKEKLYGEHQKKTEKIMKSFQVATRSLGVIFSGKKGIGKSIAGRLLCEKMIEAGYPVIVVDKYVQGLPNFIDSIEQECLLFFDEFDKTFREKEDGDFDPQSEMLSLFDGTSSNEKKLYLITCNEEEDLDSYILNRPGRFHYHIQWKYPSPEEIEAYLKDNLIPDYYGEIESVITFSVHTSINYDCLRAITFELNNGISFMEAIEDLNFGKNLERETFLLTVVLENDKKVENMIHIDLSRERIREDVYDSNCYAGTVWFNTSEIKINKKERLLYLPGDKILYKNKKEDVVKVKEARLSKKDAVQFYLGKGYGSV